LRALLVCSLSFVQRAITALNNTRKRQHQISSAAPLAKPAPETDAVLLEPQVLAAPKPQTTPGKGNVFAASA
jgi:hypothetical protein